jgi:hypothetical protein
MAPWLSGLFHRNSTKRTNKTFRPILEALEDRLTPSLVNHGGAIISNVQGQALYLGSDWSTNSTLAGQTTKFDSFLKATVSGSFMTMLAKAGYTGPQGATIGTGADTPGKVDNVSVPADLLDSQIQSDLQAAINSNLVQSPNSNTLYFVFVQDNVVVDFGNGETSVNAFLAYHSSFTGSNGSLIRYAVVPYHGGSVGNAQEPWLNTFDSMTEAASHELAEAVTDPDGTTWWDRSGNEVGDTVNGSTVYLNGYAVQRISSIPGSVSNFLPMTPAGATASHQVAFALKNGSLYEFSSSNPGGTLVPLPSGLAAGTAVVSISDQGIDDFGQPMIDIVYSNGTAYEYHDFADRTVPTFTSNPSFFPFTYLGSGVKMAVAGQAASYVLFTNGTLEEYIDPNYSTFYYGYGVNATPFRGGLIAKNVSAISAGTDKVGVNSVDYTTIVSGKTSLSEWRDLIAKSILLNSNVTAFSAGQEGAHAYVSGGNAYLVRETAAGYTSIGFTTTQVTLSGGVSTVVLGANASGYQLVVILGTGAAQEYNNTTTSSTLLGTNIRTVSKTFTGVFRVLTVSGNSFEYDPSTGTLFWTDSGDSAVA